MMHLMKTFLKSSDLTIKSIYEFAVNTPFEEIEFILNGC